MGSLLQRYSEKIKDCLHGFGRIVFKGTIRRLMYEARTASFFRLRNVLNKDYKEWITGQSRTLMEQAEACARQ